MSSSTTPIPDDTDSVPDNTTPIPDDTNLLPGVPLGYSWSACQQAVGPINTTRPGWYLQNFEGIHTLKPL